MLQLLLVHIKNIQLVNPVVAVIVKQPQEMHMFDTNVSSDELTKPPQRTCNQIEVAHIIMETDLLPY